jgi:hypothetical protein
MWKVVSAQDVRFSRSAAGRGAAASGELISQLIPSFPAKRGRGDCLLVCGRNESENPPIYQF